MIVVSETSPLNYLVLIDAVEVLPQLFGEVHAPPTVIRELQHPRTPKLVKRWAQSSPDWLQIRAPLLDIPLDHKLDLGEAEAIALAVEIHADAILVDDRKGRRIARAQGLATLGTITVLELAAERELIDLRTSLNALECTSFHCTKTLINAALHRDSARTRDEK